MKLFSLLNFIYLFVCFWLHGVFVVAHRLSLVAASGTYTLVQVSHCGMGSVVMAHGFSCSMACGILLDWGLSPRSLHCKVDS